MDSISTVTHSPPFLFNLHRPRHLPSSLKLKRFTTFSSFKPRPRTRRRNKLSKLHDTNPSILDSSSSSDLKLQTVIELDKFTSDASSFLYSSRSRFHHFLSSGFDAFHDLQTFVTFDDQNRRLIFSCRRSTVEFMGQLALLSFVFVFVIRVLLGLGSRFRNNLSYRHSSVVRRDRSLGGREVVVGTKATTTTTTKKKKNSFFGLLDTPPSIETSTLTEISEEGLKNRVRGKEKLPKWWPFEAPRRIDSANKQEYQIEANRLVRALMDNRMGGQDFMEDDIVQLRQICRLSGVKVSFNTTNMRDTFFRGAVDFVLNTYSRDPVYSDLVEINGEDGRKFVAGLAEDIGVENLRAARIVSAAVAARMRSYFLQAWALVMQDRHSEAHSELVKICRILQIFPPEESSPEIEMLTLGLKKHLKVEQRESLMNMFIDICGEDSHRTAAEALGLMLPPNSVGG